MHVQNMPKSHSQTKKCTVWCHHSDVTYAWGLLDTREASTYNNCYKTPMTVILMVQSRVWEGQCCVKTPINTNHSWKFIVINHVFSAFKMPTQK